MREILEPVEREIEKYSEDDYDNMLDEVYGDCMVCGYSMQSSYVLKEMDPIAYRCGFADYQEYETKYYCPICGEQFDQDELDEEDKE